MLKFRLFYFIAAITIFVIEVLIALYIHDGFIRTFVGDVLVVTLMYCFLRAFINLPVWKTALLVLICSYVIEVLQHFHIFEKLGLNNSKIARTVIGTTFSWTDLLAYGIGIILVLCAEKKNHSQKKSI